MIDIPIESPLEFVGAFLLIVSLVLLLGGFEILGLEKISVRPGPRTWVSGAFLFVLGLLFLSPTIINSFSTEKEGQEAEIAEAIITRIVEEQTGSPVETTIEPSPTNTLSSPPTTTPVPTAIPTASLEPSTRSPEFPRSCQEILETGQSIGDGYYTIDADGTVGRLEPFEVYCNMTRQGGGWTLYAYHTDGIAIFEVENVTLSETGVMLGERWRAIRNNMTTGMMFVDELGRETTLSARKLNEGNCQNVQNPDSLVSTLSKGSQIWHYEDSGCQVTGLDMSLIHLDGPSYSAGYTFAGASLTQLSGYKFDVWPYNNQGASYDDQDELYYYIK